MSSLFGFFLRLGILLYRVLLRPLLPPCCRFYPSCSSYMMEAIDRWGPWQGCGLGLKRLWRCRPGEAGGYDPVPPEAGLPCA